MRRAFHLPPIRVHDRPATRGLFASKGVPLMRCWDFWMGIMCKICSTARRCRCCRCRGGRVCYRHRDESGGRRHRSKLDNIPDVRRASPRTCLPIPRAVIAGNPFSLWRDRQFGGPPHPRSRRDFRYQRTSEHEAPSGRAHCRSLAPEVNGKHYCVQCLVTSQQLLVVCMSISYIGRSLVASARKSIVGR